MTEPTIVLYSAGELCGSCQEVKKFLEKRDLSFREYNIVKDRNAFEEMWHISGQKAAPVITVDGKVVVGYKKDRLEKILHS